MGADLPTKTACATDGAAPTSPPAPHGAIIYTCPMHPEVRHGVSPWRPALSLLRLAAEPGDRRRCDEPGFRVRDRQRVSSAEGKTFKPHQSGAFINTSRLLQSANFIDKITKEKP